MIDLQLQDLLMDQMVKLDLDLHELMMDQMVKPDLDLQELMMDQMVKPDLDLQELMMDQMMKPDLELQELMMDQGQQEAHMVVLTLKAVVAVPWVCNALEKKHEASNLIGYEILFFLNVWLYEALLQVTKK